MQIRSVRWQVYQIPFRSNFMTAHSTLAIRQGAIVAIETVDGIIGYGEIAPLPDFSGGTLAEALAALQRSPLVLHCSQYSPEQALAALALPDSLLSATARSGVELALLDILAQTYHLNLASFLSRLTSSISSPFTTIGNSQREILEKADVQGHDEVMVNAVIGTASIDEMVRQALGAVSEGFRCLKCKVGRDFKADLARITAVREAIGSDVALRLDANQSWSFEEAHSRLADYAALDIQYVEQPLPAGDLDGMRRLRSITSVPLAADEAVSDYASACAVLQMQMADVLVLKPQLAGGLLECQRIIAEAEAAGVRCVTTSAMETGIGVTGALHLAAASPAVTLPCGLATLALLMDDLVVEAPAVLKGLMAVPQGVGIGVVVDQQSLMRYQYLDLQS